MRLSVHRKNEERKRYSNSLPVSIPLSSGVAILPVSIPLCLLNFKIQLPIEYFLTSPIVNLHSLQLKIQRTSLPQSWMLFPLQSDALVLCKMDTSQLSSPKVQIALTIHSDLYWGVAICGRSINESSCTWWNLPSSIDFIADLRKVLDFFTECRFCPGSSEDRLQKLIKYKDSTPKGTSKVINAYIHVH